MTWKSGAGYSSASTSGTTARIRFGGRIGRLAAASLAVVLISVNFAFIAENIGITPAAADTAPADPSVPETVSAAALPTVQINGVVWDQVIVGNRVFVTGQFTQARPAGADPGTNETPRSNILAYDLTTGVLIPDWAPTLNAQGMEIKASPDGSTIYVGGEFDRVNNVTRSRIAALDAQTGALRPFNPGTELDGRRGSRSRATPSTSAATSRRSGLAAVPRTRVSRPPTRPARSCRGRRPPTASSTRWSCTRPAAA